MKWVLFIAVGLLVMTAACRSQKSVTTSESIMAVGNISAVDNETVDRKEYKWAWLMAFAESLNIRLSADSVNSPDGTVYNPVVDICVDNPVVAGESGLRTEESDSVFKSTEGELSASESKPREKHDETVTGAEPLPLWKCVVSVLCAVAIVTGIVTAYRKLH